MVTDKFLNIGGINQIPIKSAIQHGSINAGISRQRHYTINAANCPLKTHLLKINIEINFFFFRKKNKLQYSTNVDTHTCANIHTHIYSQLNQHNLHIDGVPTVQNQATTLM